MKPLNTIVADLEYCKELKELGLEQMSFFYWVKGNPYMDNKDWYLNERVHNGYPSGFEEYCSAWTASELGEMLPDEFGIKKSLYPCSLYIRKTGEHYTVFYEQNEKIVISFTDSSLADILAETLIYLLKNNIISLEEVNKNILHNLHLKRVV